MSESVEPSWFVAMLGPSPTVHQATGMIAAQMDTSLQAAAERLLAEAAATEASVESIAAHVVARRVRFD
jgi:hypothetical protein